MEYSQFNYIIEELKQIHKLHKKVMMQYCQDMTPEQGKLMFVLYKENKINQKELAKILHITEATLSVRLKRLIDAGYVEKVVDERDKRVFQIILSQQGLQLLETIEEQIMCYQEHLCYGMTDEEFHTILNVMNKMKQNIKELIL